MEMSVEQQILETGIKVVDMLAPYVKGGKIGERPPPPRCPSSAAALSIHQWFFVRAYAHIDLRQLGVARFIDASIYRDTFPAIRIAILFPRYVSRNYFLQSQFFFFFSPQLFSFRQKRYIIISTCDFCKVIPQIHSYFVKLFCEISVETI